MNILFSILAGLGVVVLLASIGAGLLIIGEWAAEQFDIDLEE